MANPDRPRGFRFAKSMVGSSVAPLRRYQASTATTRTSDSTNNHGDIYIGDPVKITSGMVLVADSTNTIAGVVAACGVTPSNTFGETQGFNPSDLGQRYLKNSDSGYVWVVPAEGNLFEVQTASDMDLVQGSTAYITNTVSTAHGSRTTGYSDCELTTATSGTADCVVVENLLADDNDITLANARHLVMFNTTAHEL